VSAYSAGNLRYVLEREFDYPVTVIRVDQLRGADLSRYQVLILPDTGSGDYAKALGADGIAGLRDWVERGGVLISLARATRLLADPEAELLATRREYRFEVYENDDDADAEDDGRVDGTRLSEPEDYAAAIESREDDPASLGGAQLRAQVDADHWMAAGVAPQLHVLTRNADIYTPLRLNEGVNVARFAASEKLLASGHLWQGHRLQLAFKPLVMAAEHGRGQLIAFTQDPTVRAYQPGLHVILANAIFRGAAHARPLR
jgi:hypothetical protein